MAHASDAQEPEPTAPQITAGNKPPTASADSTARLTPMPAWLMHWWTPLLLAGILLAAGCFLASIWHMPLRPISWWTFNPYWPPSWPFNYHWPSKDAMALCATIAGAGFAFSAWQQRSHDNAARERERTTNAQREEFWRRRDTAHGLLKAQTAAEQREGIVRYLEISDTLANNTKWHHTFETIKQQTIVDILCAHARQLGNQTPTKLEDYERENLQEFILNNIIDRISIHKAGQWNGLSINLSNIDFICKITIDNLDTESTINFNDSTFHRPVTLDKVRSATLLWQHAKFLSTLTVRGSSSLEDISASLISHDSLPILTHSAQFEQITLCIHGRYAHTVTTNLPPNSLHAKTQQIELRFDECYFLRNHAAPQPKENEDTQPFDVPKELEPPDNYRWADLQFTTDQCLNHTHARIKTSTTLDDCVLRRLKIEATPSSLHMNLTKCKLIHGFEIASPHEDSDADISSDSPLVHFSDCKLDWSQELGDVKVPCICKIPLKALKFERTKIPEELLERSHEPDIASKDGWDFSHLLK